MLAASVRTCGRSTADSMIQNCRLKSSQYTLIIPHWVIQLTTVSFCVPETRLRLPQVNNNNKTTKIPPKRMKYLATQCHPFLFLFLPQPIRDKVRRNGWIFPECNERSFSDPEHSFVVVRRRPWTRFAKQKFSQLRTDYDRGTFFFFFFL